MIFLWLLLIAWPVSADTLADNQARLGVMTGDVGLLSQGAVEWIEPHEGLPIEPGDRIRTGEDGNVELVMGENVLWILQPESEVVTEHIETNAGRFNISSGTLLGIVDSARLAGIAQEWEFDMPGSVIEIRGTQFALESSHSEGSHLGVFEGTVEVEPAETAEGLQPPVRVSAGQETIARRGKPLKTARLGPRMLMLSGKRSLLSRQLRHVQDTWSPFTPALRKELRLKFVAAPPKRPRIRPTPTRPHKSNT